MRIIKALAKGFAVVILVLAIGWIIPATLGWYGLYWKRYATAFLGNPLNPSYSWYDPLETVAGRFTAALPAAGPDENPFPAAALDEATSYAEQHDSDALVVAWRGKIVFERYWNEQQGDSLFAAHSMTKVLPAMLIGHAIADGDIASADDPVANYIEEWDTPEKRSITIRHLLNMASGIQESYDFSPRSLRMQRTMGTDIVYANLAVDVSGEPGQQFAHFNPNPQLLGIILERTTGQRFADYLSEKIWRPLGAHDAYVFVDQPGGMAHTDCCMWTAIRDWIRVGESLRNQGRFNGRQIIPAAWVAEMLEPSPAYANYGMQLWLGREYEEYRRYDPSTATFANYHSAPFAGPDVFFLDGLGKKRLYIVPSRELVILRAGPNSAEWDDARLPNLLISALPAMEST
jgi:CubicO group peptidase (beta-lactamase class C family)